MKSTAFSASLLKIRIDIARGALPALRENLGLIEAERVERALSSRACGSDDTIAIANFFKMDKPVS